MRHRLVVRFHRGTAGYDVLLHHNATTFYGHLVGVVPPILIDAWTSEDGQEVILTFIVGSIPQQLRGSGEPGGGEFPVYASLQRPPPSSGLSRRH